MELLYSPAPPTPKTIRLAGTSVLRRAAQTFHDIVSAAIVFDTELYDDFGWFKFSAPNRITVDIAGRYLVLSSLAWFFDAAHPAGGYPVETVISVNGADVVSAQEQLSIARTPNESSNVAVIQAEAGDYLQLIGYQNSGGDYNTYSGLYEAGHSFPRLTVTKIG